MEEAIVRAKATEFLNGQNITDKAFYACISKYMAEIPISQTGMKYCPVCEGAACGVCGGCHQLDKEFLFIGPQCPVEIETSGMTPCVAWSWAYIFIRDADKALNKKQRTKTNRSQPYRPERFVRVSIQKLEFDECI